MALKVQTVYVITEFSMAILLDSYPESNFSNAGIPVGTTYKFVGQKIEVPFSAYITSVKFYLDQWIWEEGIDPAHVVSAQIYLGDSQTLLATSNTVSFGDIPENRGLVEFTFSGENIVKIERNGVYFFGLYSISPDGNFTSLWVDDESPSHAGNIVYQNMDGSWILNDLNCDVIFYLYGKPISPLPTYFRQ